MKDLGMIHFFLRMGVWQNADGISLGQGKYAIEILKRFRMMECKAMTTCHVPTILPARGHDYNAIISGKLAP